MWAKQCFYEPEIKELCCQVKKCKELRVTIHQICEVLTNLMESKDCFTKNHSEKVAVFSYMLALELGLPPEVADFIHIAGHLHDIGKFALPDEILKKPGPLTREEWVLVKKHPVIGAKYLESIKIFQGKGGVIEMVLYHHERWDGKGYPYGLRKREIPLGARIIAVADAFSAMVDKRPYREPLSFNVVLEELKQGAGSQFDPNIVEAFFSIEEKVKAYLDLI
ncbi:HD domain-containing protein [Thermodesulfobacterium sp. TA1]|uniref:HD-GYP domain-containing protein n=1 Tax=Thermodesulfobacterium sp. TA1 TaxID=2234087 RepID=UPI0012319FD1|nr:HD domain-containing phosphohydrolase [Thermodesulfobacterium sp. TA1]QER41362.1 HD domain-containing protein [Thermodesulfobacterium sp. TA1]